MKLERLPIETLSLDPANARRHGERNLSAIAASLRRFGQQKPVVIDVSNVIRAGNGTVEAAKSLGWTEIDCVRSDLMGPDMTAYALADNKTAELAEWDEEMLAAQLGGLDEELAAATGFSEEELADLLAEPLGDVVDDDVPAPPAEPKTKPGDMWLLGDHRVLCGDSTSAGDVQRLMAGGMADLCFTSPPYDQQRTYTGEANLSDWDGLMRGVFGNLPMSDAGQVLVNLGLVHREGEWIPYWDAWIEWMRSVGWRRFAWYVWDQVAGMPGDWSGRCAPCFEFIFHFNRRAVKPIKFVECSNAGKVNMTGGGRKRDGSLNKWCHAGEATQQTKIPDALWRFARAHTAGTVEVAHPAVYPAGLPSHAMRSWPGQVYDPFLGSGTTLIAADQLGRKCYGMEISPAYCDVIVARWEKLTGRTAAREEQCQAPSRRRRKS